MKKAVLYARVSTDEQAKGYSLVTQLDACREFAVKLGYEVVCEFSEDYTGTVLDRPELDRLRELIAAVEVQAVVVYDIDRLARKAVYQMLIEEEFEKLGLSVQYVLGQYADSDEGRLQKQIRASIAEYEKAKIIERMKRGKRGKARSGYVVVAARPPYGYRKISEPHKAWLEIVEDEAAVVRQIFEWYIHGEAESGPLSMNNIAKRLTDLRILTRGDKKAHVHKKHARGVWAAATVCKILKNETYAGVWHFGKTKMDKKQGSRNGPHQDKRGYGKQVPRDKEEWIPVEVPAIIDREAFELAQQRVQLNIAQSPRNSKYKYLMKSRLRCAKCGYSFQGRTRQGRYQYYYCKGCELRPVKMCDMPTFNARKVESAVWGWLKEFLQNPELIRIGLDNLQTETSRAGQALEERRVLIQRKLEDIEAQLERLIDLYLGGEFPKDILADRKSQLGKLRADLKSELEDLNRHYDETILTTDQLEEIELVCTHYREGIESATFEDKRRLFELFDLRGKLALENEEKVVYITCQLLNEPQAVSLALTSPSSNIGEIRTTPCASLPTGRFP